MGCIVSVGSRGGKSLFTFTAAGQDSGSLHHAIFEAERWQRWVFQLTGTGMGYAVTLYGTIDIPTAYNEPGNNAEWFELPSPSTEAAYQWSNPISLTTGRRACFINAQIITVRAVSSELVPGTAPTGTCTLQALVEM